MSGKTITLLLLGASMVVMAPPAGAEIIPFTTDDGPYGKLWNGAVQMGAFTFNVQVNGKNYGPNIFGQWDLSDPLVGFYVDFTGTVWSNYITSADFSDSTTSVGWPNGLTSISGFTASLHSSGLADAVVKGDWWSSDIIFDSETDGASGFTGYFVTAGPDSRTPPVPEPGTLGLLAIGLSVLAYASRLRTRTAPGGGR